MKVGLLTYHSVCNFGANLQALSTVYYFKNRGIDVKVINWLPSDLEGYYMKSVSQKQREIHSLFVAKYLPLTERCYTSQDVARIIGIEKFDAVIIGSDAVFSYFPILKRIHPSRKTLIGVQKPTSDHVFPNPFWADFKDSNSLLKVMALSASAQYLDINKCLFFERRAIHKALAKFDLLTVRDRWTKGILEMFCHDRDIPITPDPVWGFNSNVPLAETKSDIAEKYSISGKYVVLSFCTNLYQKDWYDKLYANLKGNDYTVVNLAMPEGCIDFKADLKIDVPLSPIDWYNVIRFSDGYIGQRMHPMIVALANSVPVVIFDHYAYKAGKDQLVSSKIYDLLERAQLLDNYINIKTNKDLSAEEVCNRLYGFNKRAALAFLNSYSEAYQKLMQTIVSKL